MKLLSTSIIESLVRYPDRAAVVAAERTLTYRELGVYSNQVKRDIEATASQGRGLIGIVSDRSAETYCHIITCLLFGYTYTVIEAEHASGAWLHRIEQIQPDLLLAPRGLGSLPPAITAHYEVIQPALDGVGPDGKWDPITRTPSPNDVAYVLYTSGSTGVPKGVQVTHGNVAHYTRAVRERFEIDEPMAYAHISTLAADLGNTSLFLCPATGGTLHLIGDELKRDPNQFIQYLHQHQIQFLKITPSHWQAIVAAIAETQPSQEGLARLVLGGEGLRAGLVQKTLALGLAQRVFNHYGPTETTVGVATFDATAHVAGLEPDTAVPIGFPLGETLLYVKDEGGLRQVDCTGELYIGGPSVSLGYRAMEQQTKERFAAIFPNGKKIRAYRTGDIVSAGPDGCITFIGRADRQVKINGYRVELGEIEAAIDALPGVRETQVHYLQINSRRRLIAVVAGAAELDQAALLAALAQRLPSHMLPSLVHQAVALPRNANGKSDYKAMGQELERLLTCDGAEAQACTEDGEHYADAELAAIAAEVRVQFARILQQPTLGDRVDFFQRGGNSLDAIQLIAALQLKGYPVTGNDFLEAPSVVQLAVRIQCKLAAREVDQAAQEQESTGPHVLAASQAQFYTERLENPDLYLQSLLYRTPQRLSYEVLGSAVQRLVESHPLLSTRFEWSGVGTAQISQTEESCVGFHSLDSNAALSLREATGLINDAISPANGKVFEAHLLRTDTHDYLYLVAHHLVIDLVSWRILIAELSDGYQAALSGKPLPAVPAMSSFWHWTRSVRQSLVPAVAVAIDQALRDYRGADSSARLTAHTEGDCETFWTALDPRQSAVFSELCRAYQAGANEVLLAIFAQSWARYAGQRFSVDIESHGRVNVDPRMDNSRVIGWHTSTFPIGIDAVNDLSAVVAHIKQSLASVERLGVDYCWSTTHQLHTRQHQPLVCYNFLGDTDFPFDASLQLVQVSQETALTRAACNERPYQIKVSVQVMAGQLVVDISYPTNSAELAALQGVCDDFKARLANLLAIDTKSIAQHTTEGTATGRLSYAPAALGLAGSASRAEQAKQCLLITGATGYIGIYFVRHVLVNLDSNVVLLIRGQHDADALERFADYWQWYFPDVSLDHYQQRITVIAGNLTREYFGLSEALYSQLVASVSTIFNFAADIRLFAEEAELEAVNLFAIDRLIQFSRCAGGCAIHHMSTLAVAGIWRRTETRIFSEKDLAIGQELQNAYELTKYKAELRLNQYALEGGVVYVYRTGNVSGEYATARFQRNGGQNRLIQLLKACVKLGKLPAEVTDTINLTPVDLVAEAVACIAFSGRCSPRTYHLDSPHYFGLSDIFAALRQAGFRFETTEDTSLAQMFAAVAGVAEPDVALGVFWSSRPARNVKFDCASSLAVLETLGVTFPALSANWLRYFVRHLMQQKVIERPDPNVVHINKFLRRRIFSIPADAETLQSTSAAANWQMA